MFVGLTLFENPLLDVPLQGGLANVRCWKRKLLVFVAEAGQEDLFQLVAEIPIIVKDPYDAVLDDVGHKRFVLSSTFSIK